MEMQGQAKVTLREIDKNHHQRKKQGYRWLVESRINGKRTRKFFPHGAKAEAEAYKHDVEKRVGKVASGDRAILLDDKVLAEAAQAHKKLAPYNRSISDAVTLYVSHLEKEAKQDRTSLKEAITIFLEAKVKKGIKDDTVKRYRETLNRFLSRFPDRRVSSLEGPEIEKWWETFGSVPNQRANRTDVNVFFNWMVKSSQFPQIKTNPVPAPHELNKRAKGREKHARINKIPPNAMKWLMPYALKTEGKVLPGVNSKSSFDKRLRTLRSNAG